MRPPPFNESSLTTRAQHFERRAHSVGLLVNRSLDDSARAVRMRAEKIAHRIDEREIRAGLMIGRVDYVEARHVVEDKALDDERRGRVGVLKAIGHEARFRVVDAL